MDVLAPLAREAGPAAATRVGWRGLGLIGFAATSALVVAAGRSTLPLGSSVEPAFWGLLRPAASSSTAASVVVLLALTALVGCWWTVLQRAATGALSIRQLAVLGLVWALPVLVGPPLLSFDAFAYLAQGHMLSVGLDPYAGGPVLLGDDPVAGRVDPMWRANPAPYGPLALVLFRLVSQASSDLTTQVLLLRLAALLGVVTAVAIAVRLTPSHRRPLVLALALLNPVTLVHLLGGVHIDAMLAGLVATSLLLLHRRQLWWALLIAAAAVAVKVTVLPLLLAVLWALLRAAPLSARRLLNAVAIVLAPFALTVLLVPRPWAFLAALAAPGSAQVWYAPSVVLGYTLQALCWLFGLPVPGSVALTAGKLLGALAGGIGVLLLCRGGREPIVLRTAAAVLLASICLPALYPWYLAAGLFLVATTTQPRVQLALVAVCSGLSFAALPPMRDGTWTPLALATLTAVGVLAHRGRAAARGRTLSPVAPTPRRRRRPPPSTAVVPRRRGDVRPHARLPQLLAVALLAVGGLGLSGASASATSQSTVVRQAPQRMQLVDMLLRQYPDLHIVGVQVLPDSRYRVDLVQPGSRRCELLAEQRSGPSAGFVRLAPADHGTPRATDELSCPPPDAPAS